jgi:hypothetical protein
VTSTEDRARAAMQAIAGTVRGAPPLRLTSAAAPAAADDQARLHEQGPRPLDLRRPGGAARPGRRGWHRHPRWPVLAPLAAAAVVVAVAVSLVLVRGPQNGGVVPQPALANSGPGAVPRYYVALNPLGLVRGLLVGDAITGKTLAAIPPPAHMSYQDVTAAADDRTFVVFAAGTDASWQQGRWYELHLAPGTAHPVSVTATAIPTQFFVADSALSGSGKYLAVAENDSAEGLQRIIVFSVATGRPVRAWSARDDASQSSFVSLSWFDGDQAIAFSANTMPPNKMTVRRLNVGGAHVEGNLIADSQLIFSAPTSTNPMLPLVSADGQIVAYATYDLAHKRLTVNWHGYRVSAQTPAASKDTIAYQVTNSPQRNVTVLFDSAVQWVSPSGSAVIGAWFADPGSPIRGRAYFGVMSHGTFTPLRLPRQVFGQIIAW